MLQVHYKLDLRSPLTKMPRFYRLSHQAIGRPYAYAYPIGLHLIVRWCKRLYEFSYRYNGSKLERLENKVYGQGYREGFDAGKREVLRQVDDYLAKNGLLSEEQVRSEKQVHEWLWGDNDKQTKG